MEGEIPAAGLPRYLKEELTMKKLILLLALAFVMCGCVPPKNEDGSIKLNTGNANHPQVIVIDSCEYIHWVYGLAHKGNCKFCAEKRRKEQEELIRRLKEG